MFAAASVPIYLSLKLKSNLRILTILLAIFILIHGLYHVAYFQGQEFLGEGIFRTLSIAFLIIFGCTFIYVVKLKKEKVTV